MPTILGGGGGGGGGLGGGGEEAVQFSCSAMKSPVHCGNPEDDRRNIDTCKPVDMHCCFFKKRSLI